MTPPTTKKQNAILWLERTGLSLITQEKSSLLRLSFAPDTIDHLEIVDEVKLQTLIHTFVTQNSIGPLSISVVLAPDVLFEKEWNIPQSPEQVQEEQQFLDSIPFEQLIQKVWIKDNKKKLAVVNGNLITQLQQCFEKESWFLVTVAPYFVVYGPTWNDQIAKDALKKIDGIKHENMLEKQVNKEQLLKGSAPTNQDAHGRSLLPLLIPVFALLIVVLIVLLVKNARH